jgi:hypothetical protein
MLFKRRFLWTRAFSNQLSHTPPLGFARLAGL